MLQSEPLLDPHIVDRIRQTKEKLGEKVVVGIVTNGSPLTSTRTQALIEAGIDRIEISIDAVDEETFQKLRPGISFSKVIENTKNLLANHSTIEVVVRFLYHAENMGQETEFRRYWQSQGAEVLFTPMVNRVGFVTDFERSTRPNTSPLKQMRARLWRLLLRVAVGVREPVPCVLPFSWMYILVDGRVLLCCHDWGPIDIVGDLRTQTVQEVWNGEKMNHYRNLLWTSECAESLVCRNCSVARGV